MVIIDKFLFYIWEILFWDFWEGGGRVKIIIFWLFMFIFWNYIVMLVILLIIRNIFWESSVYGLLIMLFYIGINVWSDYIK